MILTLPEIHELEKLKETDASFQIEVNCRHVMHHQFTIIKNLRVIRNKRIYCHFLQNMPTKKRTTNLSTLLAGFA